MHAKTLEALPCLFSFPSVTFFMTEINCPNRDKFVQTPFLQTPLCQHSLS